MSRLRRAIESGRREYEAPRYGGDLGDLVLAEPPRRRSWLVAAGGLAIAATLLLALLPTGPTPTQPTKRTTPQRPAPRLLLATTKANQVDRPTTLLRRRTLKPLSFTELKPLSFVETEPRVAVSPTAPPKGSPTTRAPRPRRRGLSTPSLALRSMKDVTRFGT